MSYMIKPWTSRLCIIMHEVLFFWLWILLPFGTSSTCLTKWPCKYVNKVLYKVIYNHIYSHIYYKSKYSLHHGACKASNINDVVVLLILMQSQYIWMNKLHNSETYKQLIFGTYNINDNVIFADILGDVIHEWRLSYYILTSLSFWKLCEWLSN